MAETSAGLEAIKREAFAAGVRAMREAAAARVKAISSAASTAIQGMPDPEPQ